MSEHDAIQIIRGFHQPQNIGPVGGPEDIVCMECVSHQFLPDGSLTMGYQSWPCNTMQQLDGGYPD